MATRPVYLDYAAATPLSEAVQTAMQPYLAEQFYNPSAQYLAAQAVARDVKDVRAKVAGVLGAKPDEIIFTAGGSEANNLAVRGVMSSYPDANIVVSAVEHESVREPAKLYACKEAGVDAKGRLDVDALKHCIDDSTVLVSIMYANNEIGTIQPIKEVAHIIAQIRSQRAKSSNPLPLYLHTDAAQASNYLDLHVSRLGVDLMTLNGGKIYGPKQSGALYIRAGVAMQPQVLGGGQEFNVRSGTENVAGTIGFATALTDTQHVRNEEVKRLSELQDYFVSKLQEKFPECVINGSLKQRLPNNVHVTFHGQDNERLMMQLDEMGIMCATGSACSASKEETSHVLRAIDLSDAEARASLRFSMGRDTTRADIESTINALAKILS